MDAEKKKMFIVAGVGAVVIIGFLVFAFGVMLKKDKPVEVQQTESARPSFPDAKEEGIVSSKSRAYAMYSEVNSGTGSGIEDIWSSLESKSEESSQSALPTDTRPEQSHGVRREQSSPGRSGDTGLITSTSSTAPTPSSTNGRRVSSSTPKSTAAPKPEPVVEPEPMPEVKPDPVPPQRTTGWNSMTSGVISSLEDSAPIMDEEWDASDDRYIRCCFAKEAKIRTGQRVTLRLLENLFIDEALIPANSRITATCTLSDRLNIQVTGFELNGKIYQASFIGYDKNDGNPGIYCSAANDQNAKMIKRRAISEGASIASGVLRSSGTLIGSLGSEAVNIGNQVAGNQVTLTEVDIPAGYEFYLKKSKYNRR